MQPFRRIWKHVVIQPTTPLLTHNENRMQQPRIQGGAALGVTGPIVSRIIHRGQDNSGLGRWAFTTLRGKHDSRLTIVSAYCPVYNTGPFTVYQDQKMILATKGTTDIDPIKLFHHDLSDQINEWTNEGHEVILAIDANSSLPQSRLLRTLMDKTGLTDIHEDRHGNSWNIETHGRGSRRIDFILTTPTIAEYVSAAGIEAFHEISDHRGLFIDIDLEAFLGKTHPLDTPANRSFHSTDRKAVLTIRHTMRKYAEDHNMFERCNRAFQSLQNGDTTAAGQAFLSLDADLMRAFRAGENKLTPRPNTDWSPPLKAAYKQYKYWLLHEKEFHSRRDFSSRRTELTGNSPTTEGTLTIQMIQEQLQLAKRHLIETTKLAAAHRSTFLESLCKKYEQENKPHLLKIVNGIRAAEAARKLWSRIKIASRRHQRSALTHVKIPNASGGYDIIDDPAEIQERLIDRNIRHFSQATGTPFTEPDLLQRILPTTPSTRALMLGDTSDFDGIDPDAQALLDEIAQAEKLPEIPVTVDTETWKRKISRWKERTATSPSGIHLGLEKALTTYEEDGPESNYAMLLNLRVNILNGIIQTRVIPQRWQTVVSVMLEKIPNNPDINKLRTIQLMEADFNLVMGILWNSRLQQQAERFGELGHEQFGARKGHQAIDMVSIKNNIFAISEATRTSIAICDMDAKACFDRVIMPLALLRSQQLGMPAETCDWIWRIFREMRYHIKTSLGVSDRYYTSTDDDPLWGNGQGGKASPPLWVHLDTWILRVLETQFDGFHCTDPNNDIHTDVHNTVFMDDAATIINRFMQELLSGNQVSIDTLLSDLQQAVDHHSRTLTATGGKLELPKCFFYAVQWNFHKNGTPFPSTLSPEHHTITLRDRITGELDSIPYKPPHAPHRTLGAHIAPTGNQSAQIQALQIKAREMTTILIRAKFTPAETYTFIRGMAWPALTYPLATSAIDRSTLESIQAPLIQATLRSLRYNKNFPRALTFGPTELGGLQLPHLYASQGQAQILSILRHARSDPTSLTYRTLWTALRWIQLLVGSQHHFLSKHYKGNTDFLPHWYKSVRKYLTESGISCIITDSTARLQRTGDIVLMDHPSLRRFTPAQILHVNAVRLHLKVTTLADIATADGTRLRPGVRKGSNLHIPPATTLYPRQPKPGVEAIRTWSLFITQVLGNTGNRISPPLGDWSDTTQRHWPAIATRKHIAIRSDDTWDIYTFASARRFLQLHHTPLATVDKIKTGAPVDVWTADTHQRTSLPNHLIKTRSRSRTLHQFLETLEPWETELLIDTNFCENFTATLLRATTLTLASDGGVKNEEGAYSWVLDADGVIIAANRGMARGHPMQSFRAEAYGTLAALSLLRRYCEFQSTEHLPSLDHHCDNEALVKRIRRLLIHPRDVSITTLKPDADAVTQIIQTIQHLPMNYSIWHVHSHQDEHTEFYLLPRAAQLNVLADRNCTSALRKYEGRDRKLIPLAAGKIYLEHNDTIYTSGEKHLLQHSLTKMECEVYLHKLHGWSAIHSELLDWHARGLTLKHLPPPMFRFATKLTSRWLPVGVKLQQTDQRHSNACPFCQQRETLLHLFQCPTRTAHRSDLIDNLARHLMETKTAPSLIAPIHDRLKEWLVAQHNPDDELIEPDHPIMILFGYIPTHWRCTQHRAHLSSPDEYAAPLKWTRQLITQLWHLSFAIWEARNKEYHRHSPDAVARQDVEARVSTLYEQRLTLPRTIRSIIFPQDIDTLLRSRTSTLLQWITTTKTALAHERKHPTPINGMQRLTSFPQFQPRPRPTAAPHSRPSAAGRPRPSAAVASLEHSPSRR